MILAQLYEQKADRVGVSPALQSFNRAFLASVNTCVQEINARCHTSGVEATSEHDDIGIDERYLPVLSAGIDYYLTVQSMYKIEGKLDLYSIYNNALRRSQHFYFDDSPPNGVFGSVAE